MNGDDVDTALMATIAGALGIILGRIWDARSETSRWRRDQKTDSYQRLAEAFSLVYEAIRGVALSDPDADAFIGAVNRARRDKAWDHALAAVWFHGSTPVVTAASLMDRAITELFHDAQTRLFTVADWHQVRIPLADTFEGFIAAARKELGLSSVAINLFPYTPG
jgi:hypothetical protein